MGFMEKRYLVIKTIKILATVHTKIFKIAAKFLPNEI